MPGIINAGKVSGVITEQQLNESNLFNEITGASAVFSLGRNIGPMSKGSASIPIPETMLAAEFVRGGSTGKKPVQDGVIGKRTLVPGKIAGIILIPTDVIEDADIDLWNTWIRPNIPNAFGAALDSAALFGVGAPEEWTGFQSGLVPQAISKGNTVTQTADIYKDIMARNGMIYQVNDDGFQVNGWVGDTNIEADLRAAVDSNNRPLYNAFLDPISGTPREAIYGKPYFSLLNGAWFDTENNSLLIGGDFTKLIYSIRKEITYSISREASVVLPTGERVDCFQQNVVAFLMEMRVAAAVLNPPTRKNPDESTRFPFSVYLGTGAIETLIVRAEAATTAGQYYVSVTEPLAAGHKYVYQAGASAVTVTYDQDLSSGWTALPANGMVTGTAAQVVTVAEVDKANLAKASGSATLPADQLVTL
jgi:HK97 family phage major capsid protein